MAGKRAGMKELPPDRETSGKFYNCPECPAILCTCCFKKLIIYAGVNNCLVFVPPAAFQAIQALARVVITLYGHDHGAFSGEVVTSCEKASSVGYI